MATRIDTTNQRPTGRLPVGEIAELFHARLLIGGEWRDAESGRTWPVWNPATEQVIGSVACGTPVDVDSAVIAAWSAFHRSEWGRMDATERGRLLMRVGERIRERAEELAARETMDTGKPIRFTREIDVPLAAEIFTYYGMLAPRIESESRALATPTVNFVVRDPLGVVAVLTHFHDPLVSAAARIAPALAAGNAVIHRTSVLTPLSAALLAEILEECGVPEGAYNLLTAEPDEVDTTLVRHAGIDKVLFAGDLESGKRILRNAADTLKRVSVDFDRSAATLVYADADLDPVIRSAFHGVTYNKGEIGTAGPRLFVEEPVYDEVVERLIGYLQGNPPGDPMEAGTVFGPLVSREVCEEMEQFVRDMAAEGATIRYGGARRGGGGKGHFYQPTLFTYTGSRAAAARRTTYGPVLTVIPFASSEEAVRRINEGGMVGTVGLHAGNLRRAYTQSRMIRSSAVWINPYGHPELSLPYAGARLSGYGQEFGVEMIQELTRPRSIWLDMTPAEGNGRTP
jgi:aldehyde dehydrogenase (NAD+)